MKQDSERKENRSTPAMIHQAVGYDAMLSYRSSEFLATPVSGRFTREAVGADVEKDLVRALLAEIPNVKPQEGLLLIQAAECHCYAMEMISQAGQCSHPESAAPWLILAGKLMAAYAKQTELLAKLTALNAMTKEVNG